MSQSSKHNSVPRVIFGGIIQESNTFSIARSGMDDFVQNYVLVDEELSASKGRNEYGGLMKAAMERGANLLPTMAAASATSSGRIPRATVGALTGLLYPRIQARLAKGCDGIFLTLHGAWSGEDEDDLCGELLAAVREMAGPEMPIVVTLDSHANVTEKIISSVNALVGYRTFPHVDYWETGYRAAHLLFDIIEGKRHPVIAYRKVPMIVQAENHMTSRGPMRELWQQAEEGERTGRSTITSLFAVQPWLDVKEMGCSVVVIGEREQQADAEEEAELLARLFWDKRSSFDAELYSVGRVLDFIRDQNPSGPVIVSDSADSPGAGSPGDSNYVLRELLRLDADQWLRAQLSLFDAAAARVAVAAGEGRTVRLRVGHSVSTDFGEPLEIEGTVVKISDGRFQYSGGFVPGSEAQMGHSAVIAIGTLSLLLIEQSVFTGDPAMYRSVGLEPANADFVLVKSAAQFRFEYEKLSEHIFILDTPGASTANLHGLPFRHIPRPMYPFDDNFI
ncbi:M81 family metallopeptidase [Paenibacillus koleovorans]|uniref:M81 family metallopeptidase n=1 Tax=Paenibacillus koleovorans TaxID=121608 RepID=UPI000FD8E2B6|nr:M81 family metallopeptidase [Paenibacillus koleovorans]